MVLQLVVDGRRRRTGVANVLLHGAHSVALVKARLQRASVRLQAAGTGARCRGDGTLRRADLLKKMKSMSARMSK